jgi:hypothetical protein
VSGWELPEGVLCDVLKFKKKMMIEGHVYGHLSSESQMGWSYTYHLCLRAPSQQSPQRRSQILELLKKQCGQTLKASPLVKATRDRLRSMGGKCQEFLLCGCPLRCHHLQQQLETGQLEAT